MEIVTEVIGRLDFFFGLGCYKYISGNYYAGELKAENFNGVGIYRMPVTRKNSTQFFTID